MRPSYPRARADSAQSTHAKAVDSNRPVLTGWLPSGARAATGASSSASKGTRTTSNPPQLSTSAHREAPPERMSRSTEALEPAPSIPPGHHARCHRSARIRKARPQSGAGATARRGGDSPRSPGFPSRAARGFFGFGHDLVRIARGLRLRYPLAHNSHVKLVPEHFAFAKITQIPKELGHTAPVQRRAYMFSIKPSIIFCKLAPPPSIA